MIDMFKAIISILLGIGSFYGMFYIMNYIEHGYYDFWVLPTEIITVLATVLFWLILLGWNLK
jgi:predicted RND superfamily exporter protein